MEYVRSQYAAVLAILSPYLEKHPTHEYAVRAVGFSAAALRGKALEVNRFSDRLKVHLRGSRWNWSTA